MHPAVVLQMLFGFCPPGQRKWMITWRSDTVSAPLSLVDGFVWGTGDGVVRLT